MTGASLTNPIRSGRSSARPNSSLAVPAAQQCKTQERPIFGSRYKTLQAVQPGQALRLTPGQAESQSFKPRWAFIGLAGLFLIGCESATTRKSPPINVPYAEKVGYTKRGSIYRFIDGDVTCWAFTEGGIDCLPKSFFEGAK